jgi:hypothetical protein
MKPQIEGVGGVFVPAEGTGHDLEGLFVCAEQHRSGGAPKDGSFRGQRAAHGEEGQHYEPG